MADHKDKQSAHQRERELWQEMSKEHWTHWRAWGSWFSWGSPVGLGIFILLLGVTFAIVKWAASL